jgi:catechol 2,3-dioxygenase-like lactoylglutathione lyase family enzyme
MLGTAPVTTILPVKEMERARRFYEKTLGLAPIGFGAAANFVLACGGGTRAEHTALSFEVEDHDFPGLKTVNHVCVPGSEKAARFKDPEGNYLCLHQGGA